MTLDLPMADSNLARTRSSALRDARVWVAGHRGMVGSAVIRRLEADGVRTLKATRDEVDLTSQSQTEHWLQANKPDVIVLAAAKVGGILANATRPADFITENLAIELNVIRSAHVAGVKRLLFLGSTCIYPKLAAQPLVEEALLTGPLEPTNEWYAIAKIAGIKMCQAYRKQYGVSYIAAQPTNLYGPNDNYDPISGHVMAALIWKIHNARVNNLSSVTIWGTGTPRREFLHVDDLASAVVFLLEHYDDPTPINVGVGQDVTIRELAETIADVIGWKGEFVFDTQKPDGTPRKLVDTGRINRLGWHARIGLRDGIRSTYRIFVEQQSIAPLRLTQTGE